jgi:hypothetical protein
VRPPVFLRALSTLTAVALLDSCGGSTSTSPSTTVQIATGAQVLRVSACTFTPPVQVLPLLYTRVTVSRVGAEWVATAGTGSGDVELRFHQVGAAIPGSIMIAGTIRGTAINIPGLAGSLPAWDGHMNFGGAGATINGVAFNASSLFPTAGLDGTGTGSLTLSDSAGRSCTATGFSWSMFQQS